MMEEAYGELRYSKLISQASIVLATLAHQAEKNVENETFTSFDHQKNSEKQQLSLAAWNILCQELINPLLTAKIVRVPEFLPLFQSHLLWLSSSSLLLSSVASKDETNLKLMVVVSKAAKNITSSPNGRATFLSNDLVTLIVNSSSSFLSFRTHEQDSNKNDNDTSNMNVDTKTSTIITEEIEWNLYNTLLHLSSSNKGVSSLIESDCVQLLLNALSSSSSLTTNNNKDSKTTKKSIISSSPRNTSIIFRTLYNIVDTKKTNNVLTLTEILSCGGIETCIHLLQTTYDDSSVQCDAARTLGSFCWNVTGKENAVHCGAVLECLKLILSTMTTTIGSGYDNDNDASSCGDQCTLSLSTWSLRESATMVLMNLSQLSIGCEEIILCSAKQRKEGGDDGTTNGSELILSWITTLLCDGDNDDDNEENHDNNNNKSNNNDEKEIVICTTKLNVLKLISNMASFHPDAKRHLLAEEKLQKYLDCMASSSFPNKGTKKKRKRKKFLSKHAKIALDILLDQKDTQIRKRK